jgi:hypothetical protein
VGLAYVYEALDVDQRARRCGASSQEKYGETASSPTSSPRDHSRPTERHSRPSSGRSTGTYGSPAGGRSTPSGGDVRLPSPPRDHPVRAIADRTAASRVMAW